MARLRSGDTVLVRMPSWLGDFVMAEPCVASLTRALEAGLLGRLSLAGPERFFDLFEGRFEGVQRLTPEDDWSGHDAAIFLDGSMRSLWKAWRSGIEVRYSWMSGGRSWLATDGFNPALERGSVPVGRGVRGRRPRRLARPFGAACAELVGLSGVAVVERGPRLMAREVPLRSVQGRLKQLGLEPADPYILLDASARGDSAKSAPAKVWQEVLEALGAQRAAPVVLASAPGEGALAREIMKGADPARWFLFDEPPPTLGELLALVEGCQLFLGSDSGPRHLAVARGKASVILCGPTDPRHTADHTGHTTVLRREVDCGPCHRELCPLPMGPGHRACLGELSPAKIVREVLAAGGNWRRP